MRRHLVALLLPVALLPVAAADGPVPRRERERPTLRDRRERERPTNRERDKKPSGRGIRKASYGPWRGAGRVGAGRPPKAPDGRLGHKFRPDSWFAGGRPANWRPAPAPPASASTPPPSRCGSSSSAAP